MIYPYDTKFLYLINIFTLFIFSLCINEFVFNLFFYIFDKCYNIDHNNI